MIGNGATPKMEIDAETCALTADGALLACATSGQVGDCVVMIVRPLGGEARHERRAEIEVIPRWQTAAARPRRSPVSGSLHPS
jgi:hypothetical protein